MKTTVSCVGGQNDRIYTDILRSFGIMIKNMLIGELTALACYWDMVGGGELKLFIHMCRLRKANNIVLQLHSLHQ